MAARKRVGTVTDLGQEDAVRLLTYAEVADRLGVHVRTVYRLVDANELRVVHLPSRPGMKRGQPRVRITDLAAYIDGLAA